MDVVSSNYLEVSNEHTEKSDRAERGSMSTIGSFNTSYDGGERTSRKSFNASMNNYIADFADSGAAGQTETAANKRSVSAGNVLDVGYTVDNKLEPAEGQLIDFASDYVDDRNNTAQRDGTTQDQNDCKTIKDQDKS